MRKNLNIIGALFVIYIIFLSATSVSKTNSNEVFDNEIITTISQVKLEKLIENKCLEKDVHYYSYDELTELLGELQQDYSNIFMYESLGKTYQGRDIWLVKISDNVEINETEPEVLFTGGMHGNEKIGFQVTIYSLKAIAENYTYLNVNESFTMHIRYIVNNTELYFIPMVNPDGCEVGTRKNRRPNDCILGKWLFRGVDINRNFGYKWEEFDKHPIYYLIDSGKAPGVRFPIFDFWGFDEIGNGTYRGPSAFSENETESIRDFVENHDIITGIDYHSKGKTILYPWGWTKNPPQDEQIFLSIAEGISKINDFEISQGSHWYYTFGAFTDWIYGVHNSIHFIFELDSIEGTPMFETCETHLLVNLYLAERAMEMNENGNYISKKMVI
ncbi:MAG: hypothetical protein KAW45_04655 [Thermoplasmatales archaeon]|nr:hypothetical protein [Thermoplasmatales archaeon]